MIRSRGRLKGKPQFMPWQEDPDPSDYWEQEDYDEMRVRLRAYWSGSNIDDAVRAWNEELHERVQGGTTAGQFGSGQGPMGERKEASTRAAAALSPKVKARVAREKEAKKQAEAAAMALQAQEEKKAAEVEAVTPKKEKKIVTKEAFDKAKIRIRGEAATHEAFITRWNEKIGMDPEEFERTFTGGLQDQVDLSVGMSGNEFQVTGIVKDDKGNTIGNFDRDIKPDKKEAYSAYFKLTKSATGDDTGKRILGGNIEAYEAMGITTVKVTANIDVGGYAWAKYGYVPTASAWSTLSGELERKLDRETGEGGGGSSRGSGETTEADEWSYLSDDQQEETKRRWMRDSRDDFLQSEIESWRDSGRPLEDAKRILQEEFNSGRNDWALDEVKRLRQERKDNEQPDYPFNDEQILAALSTDEYESRYEDGNDDVEFTWDDKSLDEAGAIKFKGQMELPGIEPPMYHKALDDDMREEITKALSSEFNSKAENDAGDVDPPDYLSENIEEMQDEYWDQKDDSERLRLAVDYGQADIEIEPEEDDEEPEMDLTEEEKEDPEIAELYDLLRDSNPKNLWKVADSSYGKRLLLNSGWSGVLNLKDPESYARFKAYVGRVKTKEKTSA